MRTQVCGVFTANMMVLQGSEQTGKLGRVRRHEDRLMLVVRSREFLQGGLHAPDLPSVLGNGAIAGELARSSDVVDHLLGPFFWVLVGGQQYKKHQSLW